MWTRHRGYKSYYGQRSSKKTFLGKLGVFFSFGKNKANKRRDWWQKSYRNPYFSNKHLYKRTKAPRLKMALGAIAFSGALGILFFHPFFNITQVRVAGNKKILATEIINVAEKPLNHKRLFFFNGRNIFLADLGEIERTIKESYILSNLELKKKYPQEIKIILREKDAVAILQGLDGNTSQFKYYLLGENGENLQELNAESLSNPEISQLPRVQKESTAIKTADKIISKATLEFVIYMNQWVPKQNNGITVVFATLADAEGQVLNLVTNEGWKIVVDRQNDWEKQLHILNVLLREKIKDNRQNLKYIDVRYENRAFFQ